MTIDENTIDQINTVLLLIQRRIDRIAKAMEAFTESLNKCTTVEEIAKLKLSI